MWKYLYVGNLAFTYKIDILNPEGYQNFITGSRVKAILLEKQIFPIGQSLEFISRGPISLKKTLVWFFWLVM